MINEETLDKTARLSRIKLSDVEKTKMLGEMKVIIEHFTALQAVDTTGIEPLHTPVDIENKWREDKVAYPESPRELLTNTTDIMEGCVKVPQVVK